MAEPVTTRDLVLVSGYYGFGNLGDEAILEELTSELKRIVPADNIVVLSADPQATADTFGVRAVRRTDLMLFIDLCKRARLFISGGGGLFQNVRSLGSIVFYGLQIMLAKTFGAQAMIYAQGIGPLRGGIAESVTKMSFERADAITVRDSGSKELLDRWGIDAIQTADPVWALEPRRLPAQIEEQLSKITSARLVGLSLRTSHNFGEPHLVALVDAMRINVPETAHVILLPLQPAQDADLLIQFAKHWSDAGRQSTLIDTGSLKYPSEWITLFGRCKMLIGMRLHALIMSLKAGVPVAGIAYDPKVSHLLADFEQPTLNLTKEPEVGAWEQTLKQAFADIERLSHRAMKKAEGAKKLACQNFNVLARILGTQK